MSSQLTTPADYVRDEPMLPQCRIGENPVRIRFQLCPTLTVSDNKKYFSDNKRGFVAETDKRQRTVGLILVCRRDSRHKDSFPLKSP